MKFLKLIATVCIISFISSCAKEDIDQSSCNGVTVSFATEVQPIINTNCAISSCHGTGSGNGPGALTTYAVISQNKNAISAAVSSGTMPKGSSLTANDKNKILCWIQNGAANN